MNEQEFVTKFYEEVLAIKPGWKVIGVHTSEDPKTVYIEVEYDGDTYQCPQCGEEVKLYDHRERRLRHLDTCDYQTIVEVKVPRVKCGKHGVGQMPVHFAEKRSVYTELFENKVIKMLETMTTKAVAQLMRLGWDAVDNIKSRAVKRGLARREKVGVRDLGIDETSFQKGHDYVTVLYDKDLGNVLDVLDGRDAETVGKWFITQETAYFGYLESVSMDMSNSFIKAVKERFSNWENLICFDKFHIAQLLNRALNDVRKKEYAELARDDKDNNPLSKMRFAFLRNARNIDNRTSHRKSFLRVTRMHLTSSRAWRIKETASTLWNYAYMGVAEKNWKKLLRWMALCRIPQMIKAGKTIKEHLWGILNAVRMKVTNAVLEATNNNIQKFKNMAYGYRNKDRFRTDILFRFGSLDMRILTP